MWSSRRRPLPQLLQLLQLVLAVVALTVVGPAAPAPTAGPRAAPSADDVWVVSLPSASATSAASAPAPAPAQVVDEARPVEAAVFSVVEGVKSILRSNEEGPRGPHSAPLADLAVVEAVEDPVVGNPVAASLTASPSDINELAVNPAWEAANEVKDTVVEDPAQQDAVEEILEAIPSPDTTTLMAEQQVPSQAAESDRAQPLEQQQQQQAPAGVAQPQHPEQPLQEPAQQDVTAALTAQVVALAGQESPAADILQGAPEAILPPAEAQQALSLQDKAPAQGLNQSEASNAIVSADGVGPPAAAAPPAPLAAAAPLAPAGANSDVEQQVSAEAIEADVQAARPGAGPLPAGPSGDALVPSRDPVLQPEEEGVALDVQALTDAPPALAAAEDADESFLPSTIVPAISDAIAAVNKELSTVADGAATDAQVAVDEGAPGPQQQLHTQAAQINLDLSPVDEQPVVSDAVLAEAAQPAPAADIPEQQEALAPTALLDVHEEEEQAQSELAVEDSAQDVPEATGTEALHGEIPQAPIEAASLQLDVLAGSQGQDEEQTTRQAELVEAVTQATLQDVELGAPTPQQDQGPLDLQQIQDSPTEVPQTQDALQDALVSAPLTQDELQATLTDAPQTQAQPVDTPTEMPLPAQDVPQDDPTEAAQTNDGPQDILTETLQQTHDVPENTPTESLQLHDEVQDTPTETPLPAQDTPTESAQTHVEPQDIPTEAPQQTHDALENNPSESLPLGDELQDIPSAPSLQTIGVPQEGPTETPQQTQDVPQDTPTELVQSQDEPQDITTELQQTHAEPLDTPTETPLQTQDTPQDSPTETPLDASQDVTTDVTLAQVVSQDVFSDAGQLAIDVPAPITIQNTSTEVLQAAPTEVPEIQDEPENVPTEPPESVQTEVPYVSETDVLQALDQTEVQSAPQNIQTDVPTIIQNTQTDLQAAIQNVQTEMQSAPQDIQTEVPTIIQDTQTDAQAVQDIQTDALEATVNELQTESPQQDVVQDVEQGLDNEPESHQTVTETGVDAVQDAPQDVPQDVTQDVQTEVPQDTQGPQEPQTTLPPGPWLAAEPVQVQPAADEPHELAPAQEEPVVAIESTEETANEAEAEAEAAPSLDATPTASLPVLAALTTPLDAETLNAELTADVATQPPTESPAYEPGALPTLPASLPSLAEAEVTNLIAAINNELPADPATLQPSAAASDVADDELPEVATQAPAEETTTDAPPTQSDEDGVTTETPVPAVHADEVKAPGEPFLNPDDPGNPYAPETEEETNAILEENSISEEDVDKSDEQTQPPVAEDVTQQPDSQSQSGSSEEATNQSIEEQSSYEQANQSGGSPVAGSIEEQNNSSEETDEPGKPLELTTTAGPTLNQAPEEAAGTDAPATPAPQPAAATEAPAAPEATEVPTSAPAAEEQPGAVTLHEDADGDKPVGPVIVQWLRVRSEVQLRFAHTLVRAALENPAGKAQEVQLQLTLPDTGYVTGMALESDGKAYKAYVRERRKADGEYQQAAGSGQTAATVRQTSVRDSNVMSLTVTVAARSSLTVNLTYEELLGRRRGRYHHAVGIDPGQDVGEVRVDVFILESRNLSSLSVSAAGRELYAVDERDLAQQGPQNVTAGPLVVRRGGANMAHVQVVADRETQLKLWGSGAAGAEASSRQNAHPPALAAAHPLPALAITYDVDRSAAASGDLLLMDGYFVHFFAPPEVPPLRKHAIFVLDTSGSMWGHKLRQLQTAMTRILDSLHPDDFFSIVQFSSHVTEWSPHTLEVVGLRDKEATLPANKDHINKAKKFINSMEASGGTNIGGALRSAVRLAAKRDYDRWPTYRAGSADRPQPIILFLTDGLPTVGTLSLGRVLAQTRAQNAEIKAAIFSLSFGTRSNWRFLQRLSLQNDGFARRIYEAGDAAQQLQDFYQEIASPLLANVTFNYVTAKVDTVTVTRRSFPLFYGGSELVVAGRLADGVQSLEAEVEVWGAAPGASAAVGAAPGRRLLRAQAVASRAETIMGLKPPPAPNKRKGSDKPTIGLLERLWAYLSVRQLLDADLVKHEEDIIEEPPKLEPGLDQPRRRALFLALKYGFVTRVTSLVVVKPSPAVNGSTATQEAPLRPVPADGGAEKDAENLAGNNKFEIPLTRPGPGHVPISFKPLLLAQQSDNASQGLPLTAISWLSQHTDSAGRLRLGAASFSLELPPKQELQRLTAAAANQCGAGRSCKPLASCVQPAVATSFMVFRDFFCPLGTYAGVCCSL